MKKFVGLLFFFLLFGTVGCWTEHYLITGVRINPVELYFSDNIHGKSMPNYRPVTKFENEIIFSIVCEQKYVSANIINLNTGSKCYAFQPAIAYDNHLLENTASITLDNSFIYAGDIIESGVNLLHHPAIAKEITIDLQRGQAYASLGKHVTFSDTFVQNASFESEPYTVTFSCKTSDGQFLQAETTVKFPTE